MKVRIVSRSGYGDRHGNVYESGSIADLDERLAVKLLQHGIAEPVRDLPIETAAPAPRANTAKRVARPAAKFKGTT